LHQQRIAAYSCADKQYSFVALYLKVRAEAIDSTYQVVSKNSVVLFMLQESRVLPIAYHYLQYTNAASHNRAALKQLQATRLISRKAGQDKLLRSNLRYD
jgi:hypothetical protein